MMYQSLRGLGVFNAANDPTCGLFQLGIFQSRCWAEQANGPILLGQSTNVSDTSFTLPPAPATIQPPSMVTDPTGANVDIDAQIAAQVAATNNNLAAWAAAQQAASKASDPNAPTPNTGLSTGVIVAIAAVAVLVLAKR